MKKVISAVFCSAFAFFVCSCSTFDSPDFSPKELSFATIKQEQRVYNAKLDRILLIHPQSREMVSCSSEDLIISGVLSDNVEICAERMERLGFMRVTDIPRFTAPDDNFSYDNYPSGRFRGTDPTPRW